jgi:predicted nuclease of predicted toxin-antitoxin system
MRLLFDHNLSPRLVDRLADLIPNSSHVWLVGLERASDQDVWDYALAHGYTVVTKDADFSEMSVLRGFPPRVIWLRIGNCTTQQIDALLRTHREAIMALDTDPSVGVLALI